MSDPNYTGSATGTLTIAPAPLAVALSVTSSPAGPVVTGSVVTVRAAISNNTATALTVSVKATLAYTGTTAARA
ncbi:MAG: hypothetical protein WKH64_06480 [Chloroflexia bacterium]